MERVEDFTGTGELSHRGGLVAHVRYALTRSQGLAANGLPVPGVSRIEGTVDAGMAASFADVVGLPLSLRLADGRVLGITLVDASGRVLSEGHGPSRCSCC
jgi:acyl-coenzyme A thioesterase PaaI-like protein